MRTTFWTQRRFTGITLIVGCFIFLGAAGVMPTDKQGNFITNLPLREQLLTVNAHIAQLQWSLSLFITGLIVTILGLAMLTMLLRNAGDRTFSLLALVALVFGGVLMVIFLAFPLGVESLAAQATARTGVIPDYFMALTLWTNVLFAIYTILAFVALAFYGGAVLSTRLLPHWVGWLLIAYSLAGLVVTGTSSGNVPPFLQHVVPILLGILLLLPAAARLDHAQLNTRQQQSLGSSTAA
ncbi:MAG: hypothetical protein ACLQUY_14065 [Ktedonobacterales bacterium]